MPDGMRVKGEDMAERREREGRAGLEPGDERRIAQRPARPDVPAQPLHFLLVLGTGWAATTIRVS